MFNLFVDQKYAEEFSLDNKILLMPNFNSVNRSIFNENYSIITSEIVSLNKIISSHFADHIFEKKLGLDRESSRFLYYGFGTAITFLIADRLLRMSLLLENYDIEDILIPKPKYIYNNKSSFLSFYYDELEKNPVFNQWVLSCLFSRNSILLNDENKSSDNFNYRKFFAKKYYEFRNAFIALINVSIIRIKRKIDGVPFYSFGYLSGSLSKSNIFSKQKYLYNLPTVIPFDFNFKRDKIFDESDLDLIEAINLSFNTFFLKIAGKNFLPDYVISNIGLMVLKLMPYELNEKLLFNVSWSKSVLSKFNNEFYLTDSTASDPLSSFYVYSARSLGKKIISCQHSAWGGYFSNGALVTENLILGAHYYITFGWKEADPELSSWEIDCINMPSPLYSQMINNTDNRINVRHNKILLCPGFLNRFPSIYNSSLRIDEINEWKKIILNIINTCTEAGFDVDLKFYNNNFKINYKDLIDYWLINSDCNKVREFENHDLRIRYILDKDNFNYDLVIWDLAAGGFAESLVSGVPTIALSNNNFHKYYSSNISVMSILREKGLLFENISEFSRLLNELNSDVDWIHSRDIVEAKEMFIDKYVNIDFDWDLKWYTLIQQLYRNEFI